MKYLKDYFNDDISLAEWKKQTEKYVAYLNEHRTSFDELTYKILASGDLHDAKVKRVLIDGYDTSDEIDEVYVNLKLIVTLEEETYEINYIKLLNFSLNSLIEFGYGFEDILVDECMFTEAGLIHELVFVGEQSWRIDCKELFIAEYLEGLF